MRKRQLPVIIVALIVGSLAYLCSTFMLPLPEAQAHAYVIGSDPVDGSTIRTLPSVIRIFFNAPISAISTADAYVVESNGMADVEASPGHISRASSRELDIPLKMPNSLPQGSYEVRWTAVANDDGHTTYGLIGFNLGVSSNGLSGTPLLGPSTSNSLADIQALNTISILAIVWEWLARVALALWIGILVIERFVLAGSEQTIALVGRIKRQTHSLQWLCLGTLFLGEVVTLILRSSNLTQAFNLAQQIDNGNSFSLASLPQLIVGTNYGHLWLLRIALIAAAMGLLYWMRKKNHPQATPEVTQRITTSVINRTGPLQRITQDHTTSTVASLTKERQEIAQSTSASSRVQRLLSLWLLLAGLIVLTQAMSGVSVFQLHASAIVFDWLYRIVQGAWFGGIAYLAYIVFPFLPKAELERRAETV
ncbi:MAG TPA: copper resistance protein CopC, partial [Ktedonobacteraceae bacterium]